MEKEEELKLREEENRNLLLKTLDQDKENARQKEALDNEYLYEKDYNPAFKSMLELLCPECRKKVENFFVF